MFEKLHELLVSPYPQPVTCLGWKYRGINQRWISANGTYNERIQMRPLKRLSCPGCDRCEWMSEFMSEDIGCGTLIQDDIEDGALYEYKITYQGRPDWETGCIDDIELGFVKVKVEKKNG